MNPAERAQVIADEAATEKGYTEGLKQSRAGQIRSRRESMRNTWNQGDREVAPPEDGELVGRVALHFDEEDRIALSIDDDDLGDANDFYIGNRHHDGGHFKVYSWAARVASVYYRHRRERHPWSDHVVGVRVFAHRGGKLVDFQDEHRNGAEGASTLFPRRELTVPRAPVSRPSAPPAPPPAAPPETPAQVEPGVVEESRPAPQQPRKQPPAPDPELQAEDLLRRQLEAPKTVSMSSVLSTLQTDQYEHITRPVDDNLILQGHPGTGKTIIGVHRVAYMLNDETPKDYEKPKGTVLLLGPTDEYVRHVRGVLRTLVDDESRYSVRSMPEVLEELAGLPPSTVPTVSSSYLDASEDLARLTDESLARARQASATGMKPDAAAVYAELLGLLQNPPPDGLQADWVQYLRELPPTYQDLKRQRIYRYRGLLAYIGVRTNPPSRYGHVVVDEAQDIHQIEWEVLGLLGNIGGWTILGDLNQRRTDHGYSSWNDVSRLLALEDDEGRAPVQVLERGYRTSAAIIQFANRLLNRDHRNLYSIQHGGEAPAVHRVRPDALTVESVARAVELCGRVGNGTVAIITVDPLQVHRTLRKRGWQVNGADVFTWSGDGGSVRVLPPEHARGLEFDAVVVVEPADFPENVGRLGVLYTSLTRANRYLTVVHSKPLPSQLRAR